MLPFLCKKDRSFDLNKKKKASSVRNVKKMERSWRLDLPHVFFARKTCTSLNSYNFETINHSNFIYISKAAHKDVEYLQKIISIGHS